MDIDFQLEEVPPPKAIPVQEQAKQMGLCDGLRVDDSRGPYRCAHCDRYDMSGTLVWVPDSVRYGDSPEAVKEICRQNAFNGTHSGWCLSCARKLGKTFFQRLLGN